MTASLTTVAASLWHNGLAVVPLVALIIVASKLFACRPATRHALWLTALLWLVVPSPFSTWDAIRRDADSELTVVTADEAVPSERIAAPARVDAEPSVDEAAPRAVGAAAEAVPAAHLGEIRSVVAQPEASPGSMPQKYPLPDAWLADAITAPVPPAETATGPHSRLAARRTDAPRRPRDPRAAARPARQNAHPPISLAQAVDPTAPPTVKPEAPHASGPLAANPSGQFARQPRVARTPEASNFRHRPLTAGAEDRKTPSFGDKQELVVRAGLIQNTLVLDELTRRVDELTRRYADLDTVVRRAAGAPSAVRDSAAGEVLGALDLLSPAAMETLSEASLAHARALWDQSAPTYQAWTDGLAAVRDDVVALPPIPHNIWFGGAAALLLIGSIRYVAFRRRVRDARPAPREVREMTAAVAKQLGLAAAPQTLMVDGRISPMICCGLSPRLILPADLWAELDDVGRSAVVFHELAHLKRRDHWVSWLDAVIGCVYWWHPVVWWVRRRLHAEAETCCDAWVTTLLPRKRRAYAEALLRTRQYIGEGMRTVPVFGMGVTTGRARSFARRITMIMTDRSKPNLSASGVVLALTVAGLGWLTSPVRSCPKDKEKQERVQAGTPAPCVAAAQASSPETSYEKHIAAREQDVEVVEGRPALVMPTIVRAVGSDEPPMLIRVSDPNTQERIAELEAAMDRLGRQLEELSASLDRTESKSPKARSRGRGTAVTAPTTPMPPMPAMPPMPPMPAMQPGSPAPHAQGGPLPRAGQRWADVSVDDGEVVWRAYKLSDGKLEDFLKFMSRSDVPILVRQKKDAIDIQATELQHAVFNAFFQLVDPSADRAAAGSLLPGAAAMWKDGQLLAGAHGGNCCDRTDCPVCGKSKQHRQMAEELKARARAEADAVRDKTRSEADQIRSRARREAEEIRGKLRAHAREARTRAEQTEIQRDVMEREAETIREQAERLREKAERMRQRAESSRERASAGQLKDDAQRAAFEAHMEALDAAAREMDEQSQQLDQANELLRENLTGFDRQVEELGAHAEKLNERAEALADAAGALDDDDDAAAAEALMALAGRVQDGDTRSSLEDAIGEAAAALGHFTEEVSDDVENGAEAEESDDADENGDDHDSDDSDDSDDDDDGDDDQDEEGSEAEHKDTHVEDDDE